MATDPRHVVLHRQDALERVAAECRLDTEDQSEELIGELVHSEWRSSDGYSQAAETPVLDSERVATALRMLDPPSRALLDLSLRRHVSDDELGELLRTEPSRVAQRREHLIAEIAAELGRGGADAAHEIRAALVFLDLRASVSRERRENGPTRGRGLMTALLLALGIAAGALLWLAGEQHRENCLREGKVGCSVLPWDGGEARP